MIHVEKLQSIKDFVGRLAHTVILHVLLGSLVLLDDRTDDRGGRKHNQDTDRQLQGTKQIPQLVAKTLFFAQIIFSWVEGQKRLFFAL
jgi:hypothetical protein